MRRTPIILAIALAAAGAWLANVAAAGVPPGGTFRVDSLGRSSFQPNDLVQSTLRFDPGTLQNVPSGAQVKFTVKDQDPNDSHTVTVAEERDIPSSIDKVFNCGSDPNDPCSHTFECLFSGPPTYKCDTGNAGLDQPGDVLLFTLDHATTTRVTAAPGTVLHYFCAFHAWMQGTIRVV